MFIDVARGDDCALAIAAIVNPASTHKIFRIIETMFMYFSDQRGELVETSANAVEPVSSRDFRFERTFGHPSDTAAMRFDGSRSIVWVIDSLTASPLASSSIVHSESPSAWSSGLFWWRQRITRRRGGSASTISPASNTWPLLDTSFHGDPAFHPLSQCMPNQYCFMNSASVSADHNFCCVVRI